MLYSPHMPMLGFLVSYKTLAQGRNPGNLRYPELSDLSPLLEAAKDKAFVTIHYNTRNREGLSDEVHALLEHDKISERELCDGLQLNVTWPDPVQVREIKDRYPELKLIISLSRDAMGLPANPIPPKEIAERASVYSDAADYVLVDPSGGWGIPFDADHAASVYEALSDYVPAARGFAGGLSGENARETVSRLSEALGSVDFSIDAESLLRDPVGPGYGNDILNQGKVHSYLTGVSRVLR